MTLIRYPRLPSQRGLVLPTYNGTNFQGGFNSIREVFVGFATLYGKPAGNSSAIDSADPSDVPVDDILGANRTGACRYWRFRSRRPGSATTATR
jgi:hypothetical protein